ncbi:hypothetical protein BH23GEM5_BH23GEM5_14720 [soil metagenome]
MHFRRISQGCLKKRMKILIVDVNYGVSGHGDKTVARRIDV